MTFNQIIQIIDVVGTWAAAIGTISAAVIALWIALHGQRIKLKSFVGHRVSVGDSVSQSFLAFNVTNLGDRPVTITSLTWTVGKKRSKKHVVHILHERSPDQLPKQLLHGETADFRTYYSDVHKWNKDFMENIVNDMSNKLINSIRVQIHTSIGHIEEIKPAGQFLDGLEKSIIPDP